MRGPLRVVRGIALAAGCLLVSLTAHVLAGGGLHLSPGFVAGGLLLSASCVFLARTYATTREIAVVVGLSQVFLHVFASLCAHDDASPSAGMVAAHLVAAVVVTALLAQGERAVWVLRGLLGRLLLLLKWHVATPSTPHAVRPCEPPLLLTAQAVAEAVGERGPPRPSF